MLILLFTYIMLHIFLWGRAFNSSNFSPFPFQSIHLLYIYIVFSFGVLYDKNCAWPKAPLHAYSPYFLHIDREVIYPSRNTVDEIERRSSHVTLVSRVRFYPPPHLCACVCRLRGPRCVHVLTMYVSDTHTYTYVLLPSFRIHIYVCT